MHLCYHYSQAAVLYSPFYKHNALINISGRVVWDVETSLYHSRVHSSNRPTGSVLDASECEAGRNNFPQMYCNRNSSQVGLLFLGKYNTVSLFSPREEGRKWKRGKNSVTVFHRKPLCWLQEMQSELHHRRVALIVLSPGCLKTCVRERIQGRTIMHPWSAHDPQNVKISKINR